jgi:ketosteroid isomerase-like protein
MPVGATMNRRDLETVRSTYAAFARRDLDAIHSVLAPDVVIEQSESVPWGGRYVGHDGFVSFVNALLRRVEPDPEPRDLFDAGDHIVHIGRSRGRILANGDHYDLAAVHVWALRHGQITSLRVYLETAILTALAAPAPS